ncbi:MarR family transcriptional regulator [Jiangella rhizosphaerae]|uniref:MarR family transcriptional regulator n=2 Tax=Jiangella rhizosphaerae TaxID=2293569 RepID=A0A418KUX1_9ACTN|nr:MarR family transcriptional regulator [Jiangella rhizosphaerae]
MADLARRFGAAHDLDHSAARALLVLVAAEREGRDVTAGAIGHELGLSSASVTALVDRLVASGHLRREPDPHDRRRVLLRLEPSAVALGPAYFGPLAADMADRLEAFDEHDLDVVRRFLTAALEALVAHRERGAAARG